MAEVLGKKELVAVIAEESNVTKKAAAEAVDMVTGGIRSVLATNRSVRLAGFGSFTAEFKEAHTRKNNLTGEMVDVPARYRYKAKLSKTIVAA